MVQTINMRDNWLSVEEVSEIIGKKKSTVYSMVSRGKIPRIVDPFSETAVWVPRDRLMEMIQREEIITGAGNQDTETEEEELIGGL